MKRRHLGYFGGGVLVLSAATAWFEQGKPQARQNSENSTAHLEPPASALADPLLNRDAVLLPASARMERPKFPPGEDAVASMGTARFTWKAPMTVHVREAMVKDDPKSGARWHAISTFWLDVCPTSSGRLSISHRDFAFEKIMGRPISDPEIAQATEQLQPLFSAIPRLIVDRQGSFHELEGTDAMLDRMKQVLPLPDIERLRAGLSNPRARQMFEEAVALRWRAWVEVWIHFDPSKGQHQQPWTGLQPSGAGDSMTVLNVAPGRASLSLISRLDDAAALQQMQALVSAFGADPIPIDPNNADLKSELVIEVDSEWPDLRPLSAFTSKNVQVSLPGEELRHSEERSYWFDWKGSVGATPMCTPG